MKINKSQLKRIIKEELSGALSESEQWRPGRSMKAADLAPESGAELIQDSISAIVDTHGTSLLDLRGILDRMIEEDENSPIGGTEGYDDDFDAANQWDM
jgi:hypothetical protein